MENPEIGDTPKAPITSQWLCSISVSQYDACWWPNNAGVGTPAHMVITWILRMLKLYLSVRKHSKLVVLKKEPDSRSIHITGTVTTFTVTLLFHNDNDDDGGGGGGGGSSTACQIW